MIIVEEFNVNTACKLDGTASLGHPPGHGQADFGEAIGIIGGVERKIRFFAFDLPHSDACFVVGYPADPNQANETSSLKLTDCLCVAQDGRNVIVKQ